MMVAALVPSAAFAGDGEPLFFLSDSAGQAPPPSARAQPTPLPDPYVQGGEPLFTVRPSAEAVLPPLLARAQADATGYAPPDCELPLANGSFWPSGLYVFTSFVMYRQTVPLKNQLVAIRGFLDTDGNVTGNPGMFVGSRAIALETNQVRGPGTWQPGLKLGFGYRFDDGTTVDLSWMHLLNVKYTAVATLQPHFELLDPSLSNTFLFAPVFNFPIGFSGPPNRVSENGTIVNGGPFGVWNGASNMFEEFDQRNEFFDLTIRKPIFETENWRTYSLGGPRFAWFWERYKWFSQAFDAFGDESPVWAANYTNIASNRLYGARLGIGNECYLGHGLSASLDLSASGFLDVIKERTAYTRDDRHTGIERKRSRTDYTAVPSGEATFNLSWYPYRGFEFKLGYDAQVFFNTVAAEHPIDFNYSSVAPTFNRVFRLLDGLMIGGSISF